MADNSGVNEVDKQQPEDNNDVIAEAYQVAGVGHLLQRFIEKVSYYCGINDWGRYTGNLVYLSFQSAGIVL